MKMNQDIKREWVADLRSGEIHKTKYQLRRGDRMCALGVLCNIHAKHHPEIASIQTKKSTYLGETYCLPKEVRKWAGFNSDWSVKLSYMGGSLSISYLNDDYGLSFNKIADLIEQQL